MLLTWYQRASDGLWNADCACGATLCGVTEELQAAMEALHIKETEKHRDRHGYPPCGPATVSEILDDMFGVRE